MKKHLPMWKANQLKRYYILWVISYFYLLRCFVQQPVSVNTFGFKALASNPLPIHRPLKQNYDKPAVLVVNAAILTPDFKGGDARILTVIRSLQSLGYHVIYVHFSLEDGSARHLESLILAGVQVWGPITENMQVLKTRLASHSHLAAFEWIWPNPEYLSFLHAFNKILSAYSQETTIISVSDDIIYKRWEQEGNKDDVVKSYQVMESFFWKRVDIAASINSEIEEEQRRAGALHTAPLHFCSSPEVRETEARSFQERNGIAFMGYNNEANRVAIRWILTEFHTALWQRDSAIFLHIIGTVEVPEGMCRRKRGCIHHGPLEDDMAAAYISGARWFVAPVFTNAGISTKILFSLTCGTPVLTTEEGLGGMPPISQSSTPFLVVNTTGTSYLDDFLAFYSTKNKWQTKQSLTQRYLRDNFGCDRVKDEVRHIMQQAKDSQEKRNLKADSVTLPNLPLRVLWDFRDDKKSSFSIISDLIATIREEHAGVIETLGTDGISSTGDPDIFIRFLWPPDFSRPSCCPSSSCIFIVYQPWEMGFIPEVWKPSLQDVDAIWVPSLYSAKMFTSRGALDPDKVSVVPHGIRLKHPETNERRGFRYDHGIAESTRIYLYVGALLPRKGIDILLNAWCKAFVSGDNVVLIVKASYSHGGEALHQRLQDLGSQKTCGRLIYLNGFSENDALVSLYEAADILVHPSRAEGFGLTPLEALGLGKLVIAPNLGSTNDFVSRYYAHLVEAELQPCETFPCDGKAFCVFEEKDAGTWSKCEVLEDTPVWHPPVESKLAEALREIYDNYVWHQQYAVFGKHSATTHFSWSAVGKIAIYEMLKVWQVKNNGTREGTISSRWDMDSTSQSALDGFIVKHGFRNFSALEYI